MRELYEDSKSNGVKIPFGLSKSWGFFTPENLKLGEDDPFNDEIDTLLGVGVIGKEILCAIAADIAKWIFSNSNCRKDYTFQCFLWCRFGAK